MRGLFVIALTVWASAADALPMRAGADAGLFFRGEAGGNRTVLPTLAPRLSLGLPYRLSLSAAWPVAYAPAGDGLGAVSSLHHRPQLRAEFSLRANAAAFYLGAGAGLLFTHSWIIDGAERVSAMTVRAGPVFVGGMDVAVGRWLLRCGVETAFAAGRRDVLVLVGATLPVGARR